MYIVSSTFLPILKCSGSGSSGSGSSSLHGGAASLLDIELLFEDAHVGFRIQKIGRYERAANNRAVE
jgi:hypothetical protein